MKLKDLLHHKEQKSKILLLGMGKEITQFLDWLLKVVNYPPQSIVLADKNPDFFNLDLEYLNFNKVILGEDYLASFNEPGLKLVFKSPGIWSLLPQLEDFRKKNGKHSVVSSLVFFLEKYRSQIILVTGTKGKSTTCAILSFLMNKMGFSAIYCGNSTGISPYKFWRSLDQDLNRNQFFVIEISSFQLQDLDYTKTSSKYGILTNYYIDHQDQHKTPIEYWKCKDSLFRNAKSSDFRFFNQQLKTYSPYFQKSTKSGRNSTNRNFLEVQESATDLLNQIQNPNIFGKHNKLNLLLSLLVVEKIKNPKLNLNQIFTQVVLNQKKYSLALTGFQPLPHRLSKVKEIQIKNHNKELTVQFYDDGYSTAPQSVAKAIKSLLTIDLRTKIWLFVCGKDKGGDFGELVETLTQHHNQIYEISFAGEFGEILETRLTGKKTSTRKFKQEVENFLDNFENKVKKIIDGMRPFESKKLYVLFSPGGSSFDEFENYSQRVQWWLRSIKPLPDVIQF